MMTCISLLNSCISLCFIHVICKFGNVDYINVIVDLIQ